MTISTAQPPKSFVASLVVLSAANSTSRCIVESGHKLGDRFREHLLDVKNKDSDLSKPVARYFNLRGHSHELTRKFTNQFTPRKQ